MHDYSIDRHPRVKILFYLSFAAIWASPLIAAAITASIAFVSSLTGLVKNTAVTIPAIAIFGIVYWLFNTRLWKVRLIRRLILVPDLNGVWECKGVQVRRQGQDIRFEWSAKVTVTQSWSRISIRLKTDQSGSQSTSASVVEVPGAGFRLIYTYRNDPRPGELELQKHDGIVELEFDKDCQVAVGHYFTDQHRQTAGEMSLTRS